MKIITISREFGSGGRELGKRLADRLGFDYYDNEIITSVAARCKMDPQYVERTLNNHGWKEQKITFHGTLASAYSQAGKVTLLLQQKKVIEQIARLGNNCVIVGRNADIILKEYHPFNIFVCAENEAKIRRCMERADKEEQLNEKGLLRQMKQIDKVRAQTRELIGGGDWGNREHYHLTVNTTDWEIKELVPPLAHFIKIWFGRNE